MAKWGQTRLLKHVIGVHSAVSIDGDAKGSFRANIVSDPIFRSGLGRPGRITGTRELVAHQNVILVYDVAGDRVRMLRVLHAARQWPPLR